MKSNVITKTTKHHHYKEFRFGEKKCTEEKRKLSNVYMIARNILYAGDTMLINLR